jgi:hypothetical protein
LIEKLKRMEARIQALESELHRKGETAENKMPKARTAASRGNPAKAPAGAKDTAPGFPSDNETAALEPPPPAHPAQARNVAPMPGYLGAKETTALESPPPPNIDLFGVTPSPLPGLKIGAYGELRFGAQQNPAANGQWQTGFDAARVVLLPTYQFNDNIIFNSEFEFEHAGRGVRCRRQAAWDGRDRAGLCRFQDFSLFQHSRARHRFGADRLAQSAS